MNLTENQIQGLLDDLCIKFGVCLAPAFQLRLKNSPPTNAERFANVVYRAEGLDPTLGSDLYKMVLARVTQEFEGQRDTGYNV